jgi:L-aspartate oxidase
LIVESAIARRESRGLHYNVDYPDTDDEHWLKDTVLKAGL